MKSLLYGLDIAQQLNNNKKKKSMFKEKFLAKSSLAIRRFRRLYSEERYSLNMYTHSSLL